MTIPPLASAAIALAASVQETPFQHSLSHRMWATHGLAGGVAAKMKVCFA